MATQTIENFNTLDLETLASVEGGRVNWGTMGSVWGLCRRRCFRRILCSCRWNGFLHWTVCSWNWCSRCSYWRRSSLTWLLRRTAMTHRVSKRDIVLFVIAQVVSISLLVLFFSQLLHNLSSVFQLVYIVAALLVVVVDILLIRKIMTRREEPTVLNQLKASLSLFLVTDTLVAFVF